MECEIKTTTVQQVADLLMLQYNYATITSSYPDVCTAFIYICHYLLQWHWLKDLFQN